VADREISVFVPRGSIDAGRLRLEGDDAERLYQKGVGRGMSIVALDDSGWRTVVELDRASPEIVSGDVKGRELAGERRTKVSIFHALLHPADFRRLLTRATAMGVAGITPVIADGSVVPAMGPDGRVAGQADWTRIVRDAAESSGRGRLPEIGQPMLFTQGLELAVRSGTPIMLAESGDPLADVLAERPFSIDVLCPPPGGFSAQEVAMANNRGVASVAPPPTGRDPVESALTVLSAVYTLLEDTASV
jgi:RsmE family RNA methyltransferase